MDKKWIIALVLGLAAGIAHYVYAKRLQHDATGGRKVDVLISGSAKMAGDSFKKDEVAVRSIPVAYVDKRFIKADSFKEIDGVPLTIGIEEGEILAWSDFASRKVGGGDDIARFIEPGKRAMTIPVNASLSLSGMLRPGHRVDILGTFTRSGTEPQTIVLLQNITVLATGSTLDADSEKKSFFIYNSITLSVTLEESELLSFASGTGNLSAVLRGHQDLEIIPDIPGKGMDDILKKKPVEKQGLGKKATQALEEIERIMKAK